MVRTFEQEESAELHIARDEVGVEKHGSFISPILEAFINSDEEYFEMLRPLIRQIIRKEHMRCNCVGISRPIKLPEEPEKRNVYVVLGANGNFLGWTMAKDESEAETNLYQGGGPRSTFGESPCFLVSTRNGKWKAISTYEVPEEWRGREEPLS